MGTLGIMDLYVFSMWLGILGVFCCILSMIYLGNEHYFMNRPDRNSLRYKITKGMNRYNIYVFISVFILSVVVSALLFYYEVL